MRCHITLLLAVMGALLLAALSTGSAVFLTCVALLLALLVLSLVSVLLAAHSLSVHTELSGQTVRRGDDVTLLVTVSHKGLLPVAPVRLKLADAPDMPAGEVRLRQMERHTQTLTIPFHASHVGVVAPGVESITVEDLFGMFSVTKAPPDSARELLVLPLPFATEDLKFAQGDSDSETMHKATEDVSDPADVRGYQPGDALKKIHWKLSLRKNELMVRRFEEPVLPDALVLMDCSPPPTWGHPEAEADIRDTMLETAASVVAHQLRTDGMVRLPLQGSHPVEFEKSMGLPLLLEELARLDFSETDRFERVLLLETRRMRKTGCTVVITARLNGAIVDVIIRMRRMGPYVRLYLVTFAPDDPRVLPLVSKLQQATVEVCYVTPLPG